MTGLSVKRATAIFRHSAAGAFSRPPSQVPSGPKMLWKRTVRVSMPYSFAVVQAELLGRELLPAVGVLRLRGIGVIFLQRHDVGLELPVLGIDAGRRRVEVAPDAVGSRCLQRVEVDQGVVVEDLARDARR